MRSPITEMRGIQPFPAQQRSNVTRLGAGVGFSQVALLIVSGEIAVDGFGDHFGIGLSCRVLAITILEVDRIARHLESS